VKVLTQYRWPAEWERQSATWLSWSHNEETWPQNLSRAQAEFVSLVEMIARSQLVNVLVPPRHSVDAAAQLNGISNVKLVKMETNDAWARDYAPTFVIDQQSGELVAIDWYYNAWGGKYPPFEADQNVAKQVADLLRVRHVAGGLCFEGGAIEINEAGVVMTTESCALNPNRNAGFSRIEIESILRQRLGCNRIIWLPGDLSDCKVLPGDDTDGHIDQLARFVDDQTIVHAWVDEHDFRHKALSANVEAIRSQLPEVKLVPLEIPPLFEFCDRKIPASYCNFLITNESVIVPQFDVPHDVAAADALKSLFLEREIVPLPSKNLAVGLGSFHCLSQQQPAAFPAKDFG
jgi:agmatine deiminase